MSEEEMPDFAYFGECENETIENMFLETFGTPAERLDNCWKFTLSNGNMISVMRRENGVAKFREFFPTDAEIEFLEGLGIDRGIFEEAKMEREASELKTWLSFYLTRVNDNPEGWNDLRALKNKFLESNSGFAYDDEGEVTVLHPCGNGIYGEYIYDI